MVKRGLENVYVIDFSSMTVCVCVCVCVWVYCSMYFCLVGLFYSLQLVCLSSYLATKIGRVHVHDCLWMSFVWRWCSRAMMMMEKMAGWQWCYPPRCGWVGVIVWPDMWDVMTPSVLRQANKQPQWHTSNIITTITSTTTTTTTTYNCQLDKQTIWQYFTLLNVLFVYKAFCCHCLFAVITFKDLSEKQSLTHTHTETVTKIVIKTDIWCPYAIDDLIPKCVCAYVCFFLFLPFKNENYRYL